MVRENPALSFWDRLLPFYRQRDWDGCIRELRPVLDADEDALVPRLLCAGLHLAAAQPVLALVQYETLLPLAVGQGDFYAAIAVQRRLDLLHPASVTHAKRYEVLRRWFHSLGRNRTAAPGDRPGEISEAALLALDSAAFTRVMEASAIEGLNPDTRTLSGNLNACRIALYGRARWLLQQGDDITLLEGLAERGQAVAVDPGIHSSARLVLTAELPTEFLVFDAEALAALNSGGAPPEAAPASAKLSPKSEPKAAAKAAQVTAAVPPAVSTQPATSAPPAAPAAHRPLPAPAARPDPPPVARPQPDPRFEPSVASHAPAERRRESRIAINLESGIARIGLVDTRVAPIGGRLTQLSAEFAELVFSRADLRHLRTRLEGSCLALQFNLGVQTPLVCTGRVRWTSAMGTGAEANELRIEVEILPLRASERERLAEAARRFASGMSGGASPARAA